MSTNFQKKSAVFKVPVDLKMKTKKFGERVQMLRVHTALAEGSSEISSTHNGLLATLAPLPGESTPSFVLMQHSLPPPQLKIKIKYKP